jgi:hypothetical protein
MSLAGMVAAASPAGEAKLEAPPLEAPAPPKREVVNVFLALVAKEAEECRTKWGEVRGRSQPVSPVDTAV